MKKEIKETIQEELQDVELIVDENTLRKYIHTIRGVKVMLDFDLARIYGYETKYLNRQVQRNIDKFEGDEFMFQLTETEIDNLTRCQIGTPQIWTVGNTGGRTYYPYAFTEQGVYMLMTVLKGELAIKQSRALVKAFKTLKDYYVETNNLLSTNGIIELVNQVHQNKEDISNINNQLVIIMDNFTDASKYKHFVIYQGQRVEADIIYQEIYSLAKKSLYIIDDYIGPKTVMLLKHVDPSIDIKIFSDDVNKEKDLLIEDYYKDTGKVLEILPTNNVFHDRYIIIDYLDENEKIFHSGPSSKDAGNKVGTIIQIEKPELYHSLINELLNSPAS